MRRAQKNLFDYFDRKDTKKRYARTEHGGAPTKGKRKLERPLSTKKWIHLILRSDRAKGPMSFLVPKNKLFIQQTLKAKAKKFGVTIGDLANVGNHLHIKIKITSRGMFQKFLKSITTLIARKLTGARRGKPFGRFWLGLAYTRVLMSYTEELNLQGYFIANRLEGGNSREARERFLKRYNDWVYKVRNKNRFSSA
jgi:hypothetical protein